MSVVIRESHATNDQPLFLSVNGGKVSGEVFAPGFDLALSNGTPIGSRMTGDGQGVNGKMYLQGSEINFTQMGIGNANSKLQISPYPTNADVMTVGGNLYVAGTIFGIGPAPTSTTLDAATKPVAIGSPATFTVSSPLFPLVAGAEYDVQCNGYWTFGAGNTVVAQDYTEISLSVGAGTAPGYLNFTATDYQYPNFSEDPWTANSFRPFKIRARMISNGIPAMVLQAAVYTPAGTGAYPALQATITTLDIVRVK